MYSHRGIRRSIRNAYITKHWIHLLMMTLLLLIFVLRMFPCRVIEQMIRHRRYLNIQQWKPTILGCNCINYIICPTSWQLLFRHGVRFATRITLSRTEWTRMGRTPYSCNHRPCVSKWDLVVSTSISLRTSEISWMVHLSEFWYLVVSTFLWVLRPRGEYICLSYETSKWVHLSEVLDLVVSLRLSS